MSVCRSFEIYFSSFILMLFFKKKGVRGILPLTPKGEQEEIVPDLFINQQNEPELCPDSFIITFVSEIV